jgi:hypothetical protein
LPYLTPSTNPTDTICRVLLIPNDPLFIANVTGALEELTFAYNWEEFGAVTVDDAKNAMLTMFNSYCFGEVDSCLSSAQFRQHDDCLLQFSQDGGITWETLFDASSCVDALVRSGRYAGLGPQQPVGSETHGACRTMSIVLYANSVFQWPELIATDDVITVNIFEDHGWSGTLNLLSDTHCADGGFLDAFLQCGGAADPGHTGDPLPAANHMRLVMEVDGIWEDAYNVSSTVRGGVSNGVLTVQANDDVLLDNAGWIGVSIEVCKSGWTHVFDFLVNDGGWVEADPPSGSWTVGNGWVNGHGGSNERLHIKRTFTAILVYHVKLEMDWTFGSGDISAAAHALVTTLVGSNVALNNTTVQGTPVIVDLDVNDTIDQIYMDFFACENVCSNGSVRAFKVTVTGGGTDPF